jgi:hypothetical protein
VIEGLVADDRRQGQRDDEQGGMQLEVGHDDRQPDPRRARADGYRYVAAATRVELLQFRPDPGSQSLSKAGPPRASRLSSRAVMTRA